MRKHRSVRILKIALLAILALGAISFLVMVLWNSLMPSIFAVRAITFWQALGLLLLSKILFGGFRHSFGGGRPWRRGMMERWERMTPEERESFKQGMRRGCGPNRDVGSTKAEAQA